ncbi:hypothetical protein KBA39_08335 [Myxococcota bacterium]|nr:hypothetical protein [Myxococcota bacterium]
MMKTSCLLGNASHQWTTERFLRIMLTVFVFLGTACAGQRQLFVREASKPTPPSWLTNIPFDAEFVYAVGSSSGAESLQTGREIARNSAAGQLSAFIGVDVESGFGIRTSHDDRFGTNTTIDARSTTRTSAKLLEIDVVDEYYVRTTREAGRVREERFDVHLLCRYRKSSAAEERERLNRENEQITSNAMNLFLDATNRQGAPSQTALAKLTAVKAMLERVPDSTPLPFENPFGADENAGTLKREVANELRAMEAHCRTLIIDLDATSLASNRKLTFVRELGQTLTSKGVAIGGDGRFVMVVGNLEFTAGGYVFAKRVVSVSYSYEIRDLWNSGRVIGSGSGISKGFGNSFDDAADDATRAAASRIGLEAVGRLSAPCLSIYRLNDGFWSRLLLIFRG